MLASLTLVPALCGLAGRRVLLRRSATARRPVAAGGCRPAPTPAPTAPAGSTARWAAPSAGGRSPRPWRRCWSCCCCSPRRSLGMRTWPQDAGSQPTSNTTRLAYDLVAAEFGPGANGPLAARRRPEPRCPTSDGLRWPRLARRAGGRARSAPAARQRAATPPSSCVEPTTGPQDERDHRAAGPTCAPTAARRRRWSPASSRSSPTSPTGWPTGCGSSSRSSSRSRCCCSRCCSGPPVVAVKAAVMNLLSIAAAYGVMTAVFQRGWARRAARPAARGAGVELGADPDVRRPVRPVDGLRGVPAVPDPRGLAAHRRRAGQRGPRPVRDRPGDHRRGGDHGRGLPRLRPRPRRRRSR